jgi:TolB-like protein/DNA-binding winged helix-turn-helix (wHTH) protein/Flp pilus assembly protein TadD
MPPPDQRTTLRFGDFELDEAAYELRRLGRPVKLGRQPMDLLLLLVAQRGQLVSRGDIIDRLWGKDVFVDVDTGVNTAISKIRQALRDSPDAPAFLETVPGKGYRFVAAVETVVVRQASSAAGSPPDFVPDHASESAKPAAPLERGVQPPAHSTESPGVGPTGDGFGLRSRWTGRSRMGVALLVVSIAISIVALRGPWRGRQPTGVTVAVLPFQSLGADVEREYLAAGLTDETSAFLAQVDPERLSVKGRSLQYKGSTKTVAEIGRELSVDYLVQSSIRAEGNRVRVTVALIRVHDQAHVWSQSFDRESTSLLGLQQELSAAIAQQIRLRLSPDRLSGLGRRQTENADAYDAYLRGRDQAHRRTAEGNARAIAFLKQAVAIDRDYALAWSDLAFAYAAGAINGDARPAVVGPLARDAVSHAVRANASLAETQMALGYGLWLIDWNWTAAYAALQRAVDLDQSNASAYRILGHALSQSGRRTEAESAMQRARELDPLDAMTRALSAQVAFQARDLAAARDHAQRAIVLDPGLWVGYVELAQAYEGAAEHQLALEALEDADRLGSGNSKIVSFRGYTLARWGREKAAREALSILDNVSHAHYVPPYAMALIYAGLDEREPMFEYLEQAYAARDVHLMYLPVDMKWDPYRTDPRFVGLLARCGFMR